MIQITDDSRYNDSSHSIRRRSKHLWTFKDVEETMDTLSGGNSINVKVWLKEFEEWAAFCKETPKWPGKVVYRIRKSTKM